VEEESPVLSHVSLTEAKMVLTGRIHGSKKDGRRKEKGKSRSRGK